MGSGGLGGYGHGEFLSVVLFINRIGAILPFGIHQGDST